MLLNSSAIMLSERSPSQRATFCVIALVWRVGKGEAVGTENTQGWAKGGAVDYRRVARGSFGVMVLFHILIVVVAVHVSKLIGLCTKNILLYVNLKNKIIAFLMELVAS